MGAFDDLIPASQSANPGAFDDLIPAKPTGGLVAAAKQAIGASIKGVGQAATDFLPGVTAANPISQYGQEVIDANPTAIQSLGDIADKPWTAIKEAVGNAGASLGGMLGARALGTGITMAAPFTGPAAPIVGLAGQAIANVGPFVAAALPSYGGIREKQIEADPNNEADGKSKAIAMLGAGTVGAIEGKFGPQAWALAATKKGGIEAIAKQFADAKSIYGAVGKGLAKGAAVEGAEELVQNPIEQVSGYQDPTTRQAIGETLLGGAMGSIGGGVLGGGMAGVAYRPQAQQPQPPAQTGAGAPTQPATTAQPAAIDPVADPVGTLNNPQAGAITRAAATGEITGANEQKRQEQAIVAAAQTTGTTNKGTQAGTDGQEGSAPVAPASTAGIGGTGASPPASGLAGMAGAVTDVRSAAPGMDRNANAEQATNAVAPPQDQAVTLQQAIAAPPRLPVGDPAGWMNTNSQQSRDIADRAGVTQEIESLFATGLTVGQVLRQIKSKIAFVPHEDQTNFIVQVRATLGIPSQQSEEGKQEFAAWKADYDKRQSPQITPPAPALPVTPAAPTSNQQAEPAGAPTGLSGQSSSNVILGPPPKTQATPQGQQDSNQAQVPEPAASGRAAQATAQGVAPALQYPQQPTTGGGAIEQTSTALPMGEYGKAKAPAVASQSPVPDTKSPVKPIGDRLANLVAKADEAKLAGMAQHSNAAIRDAAVAEVARRKEMSPGNVSDTFPNSGSEEPKPAISKQDTEYIIRARIKKHARNMGVLVIETNSGWHTRFGEVSIPAEDAEAEGAISANHVFAHELGHAAMQKRGLSFKGFPIAETRKWFKNWDELVRASKEYRPGVWNHANKKIRAHARKPEEVIADAIASVIIGSHPLSLLRDIPGLNERDIGFDDKPKPANPADQKQATQPAASTVDATKTPSRAPQQPLSSTGEQQPKKAHTVEAEAKLAADDIGAIFDKAMDDVFGEAPAAPAQPSGVMADEVTEPSITRRANPGAMQDRSFVARAFIRDGDIPIMGVGATEQDALIDMMNDADRKRSDLVATNPPVVSQSKAVPKPATETKKDAFQENVAGIAKALQAKAKTAIVDKVPDARKPTEAAASAAKNASMGLADVAKGLNALFKPKPGTLGMGLPFDEDTYAAAKPYFQAGIAHFKQAGADIAEMMKSLIMALRDQFGMDRETITAMKPYVVRFMEDAKAGKLDYDEASTAGKTDEATTGNASGTTEVQEVGSGGDAKTRRAGGYVEPLAPGANLEGVEGVSPADAGTSGSNEPGGKVRGPDASENVGGSGKLLEGGDAVAGLPGRGRTGVADDVPGRGLGNYHVADPEALIGGSPRVRFARNKAAIETFQIVSSEGRAPTQEERDTIARFIGWGSFGQELFNGSWHRPAPKPEWKEADAWLREHLGKEEWESAQASIINAHYTDPPTVQTMWNMVRQMGFTGGRVLEPSMGIGNFFGMMPRDLMERSQLTGIEMDSLTGGMAKMLYPDANINIKPYQDSKTSDGFYDLVIGNWPFAAKAPLDRRYMRLSPTLHDYFFLKALDQTRAGGIVIGITSSGTMDKAGEASRYAIAKKADLIGAFRLPSGAFEKYAGTSVVTDILVFRKREEENPSASSVPWLKTEEAQTPQGTPVKINAYFANNPQFVLGTTNYGHGTTRGAPGMIVDRPGDMMNRLQAIPGQLPEDAYSPAITNARVSFISNHTNDRQQSVTTGPDNGLYVVDGEHLKPLHEEFRYVVKDAKKTAAREAQVRALIALRKAYASLLDAERGDEKAATIARKKLNAIYKAFVNTHGTINGSDGLNILHKVRDPFFPSLAALEVKTDQGYVPSAILSRPTMRAAKALSDPTVSDAFVLARNKSMVLDMESLAKDAGVTVAEATRELVSSGAVFKTPVGNYEVSDVYLSGNVRRKLHEAEAALKDGDADMATNIEALKKVIPPDEPYYRIEAKLGAPWISPAHYRTFVAELLGVKGRDVNDIHVENRMGRWVVAFTNPSFNRRPEAMSVWGTDSYPFSRLVRAAMNNLPVTIRVRDSDGNLVVAQVATEEANTKIANLREHFSSWVWSDIDRRTGLEKEYNEVMRAIAAPKFDGSFLDLAGMALQRGKHEFNLRQHQVDAIWRGLVNQMGIYAHEVGTGKTYTMAGLAIESRRYGLARKPLIFAHNANSASVAREFQEMYPAAKLLYIDNLSPSNIATTMRQIANDDWDAVIVPHSLIERFALTQESLDEIAREEIALLEEEAMLAAAEDNSSLTREMMSDDVAMRTVRSPTAKELVKARNLILARIAKMAAQSSREDAISFEELGVDMIIVDEAHEFKKPPLVTRMKMKGLNKGTSNRSVSLRFLTDYVKKQNSGKGVHLFTGTPITNTLTEIYNLQRYVADIQMQRDGVKDWDAWFSTFADSLSDVELTSTGEYDAVTRLSTFINTADLRNMIGAYTDIVFADDMPEFKPRSTESGKTLNSDNLSDVEKDFLLNGKTENPIGRPYKKVVNDVADMTEDQREYLATLQQRATAFKNAQPRERKRMSTEGHINAPIIIDNQAPAVGLDPRFFDLSAEDHPNLKVNRAAKNILRHYNEDLLATQIVFVERGYVDNVERTRRDAGGWPLRNADRKPITEIAPTFNLVSNLIDNLVNGGIPRAQIAIVSGSTSRDRRMAISDAMNAGTIRVVIGMTSTLGIGVNMQKHVRAMHHLDAPWMPGDLEQRNGRGQRQGNQWNTVLEYRYITDRVDGRRWQVLAIKDRFIKQFLKANSDTRIIEGDAVSDSEGDTDIMESLSEAAGDPRIMLRQKLKKDVEQLERRLQMHEMSRRDSAWTMRNLTNEIAEKRATLAALGQDIEAAQPALEKGQFSITIDGKAITERQKADAAIKDFVDNMDSYRGGEQKLGSIGQFDIILNIRAGQLYGYIKGPGRIEYSVQPSVASITTTLRNLQGRAEHLLGYIKDKSDSLPRLKEAADAPFPRADVLAQKQKLLQQLEADLQQNPVPPPPWLRQGAPVETFVYVNGKPYVVEGHQHGKDGFYVIIGTPRGPRRLHYGMARDEQGMDLYEAHLFTPPVSITPTLKKGDEVVSQNGMQWVLQAAPKMQDGVLIVLAKEKVTGSTEELRVDTLKPATEQIEQIPLFNESRDVEPAIAASEHEQEQADQIQQAALSGALPGERQLARYDMQDNMARDSGAMPGESRFSKASGIDALSHADRAVYSMAADGKSADEILSFIAKASRRPFNRVLAAALRRAGLSSTVTLDSASRFGQQQGAQRYAAAYNSRTDTVALFTPRDAERHALHELVHAATMRAIKANGLSALRLRALFKHVQQSGMADGQYGMSNLDEFVAEVFTNPEFQALLKTIPAPKGSALRSAWEWFVRIVARIVGIRTRPSETALDRALTLGAKLMRENVELAGLVGGGDTRYAIAWHGTPHVWPPEPGFPHGRPRLDKIGSGEGAQVYGWGWYSAESEAVAEQYRIALSATKLVDTRFGTTIDRYAFVGSETITDGLIRGLSNDRIAEKLFDRAAALDRLSEFSANVDAPLYRQAAEDVRAGMYRLDGSGTTYKLDIPDDVTPKLLDWDKPLSEQSPAVRKALIPVLDKSHEWSKTARWPKDVTPKAADLENVSGEMLLKHLRANNPHGKPLEDVLREAGVPGLRYLDGTSRNKGEGTYNYVIWDQNVLDRIALLERNGEKLDAIRAADEMRFSIASGQPFDGRETAATPLKPGTKTMMVDGTERPALNSNGKPIHWSEEGVRNFWRWFSGSAVVDEQGRPLVVYHGTGADIAVFRKPTKGKLTSHLLDFGFHFGTAEVANTYASLAQYGGRLQSDMSRDAKQGEPAVYPTYLAAQAVVDLTTGSALPAGLRESALDLAERNGMSKRSKFVQLVDVAPVDLLAVLQRKAGRGAIKKLFQDAGYSGIRYSFYGVSFVVFNPNQIKSATGNAGAFSPDDPDIRFSIATDWQQSPVAQEVSKAFKAAARSDAALSWLNPVQTQYHKAERLAQQGKFGFKRVFELGQKFLSDISRFAIMAENSAPTLFHQIRSGADVKQAIDAAMRGDFGKQHNADIRAIAKPLYEGTLYGGRNPMAGMVWTDEQLRARFGLTDRQINLYHEARDAVQVSMDEMAKSLIAKHAKRERVMVDPSASLQDVSETVRDSLSLRAYVLAEEAQSEHDDTMQQVEDLRAVGQGRRANDMESEAKAKLESQQAEVARIKATVADVQAISDKAQKLQDAGYFPLMRFGRHTVTAKDENGKVQHFSMHDGLPLVPRSGQAQANLLADALRDEHPDWDVQTGLMNPEKYKLYQGMSVDALQLFADHLDADTKQTYQEILRLATNERSALKRMLKREGTPGFDRDVRRTLASFILSNARYTSSAYNMADMAKAAEDANEDGGDIGAEAVKLYEYVAKPQEEAAKIRGFLFFNFLGGSLAAAMVNATQVPMMTFPRLAQYEQAGKLAARLGRAAKLAVSNPADIQGDIGAALRRAEENGITAPHQIYEMTATAANNVFTGSRAGSALLRAWGAPFALAESFNRRTTFIAAYQIGQGMTANQLRDAGAVGAFEFAEKMVQETQGIYNRGNRVNIGRGAIGATVMTFKQFSIMYLEMFGRLPARQKAIMAGMLILAAGAGGLPFAEDIEDIIDTIGQWLGYRTNTRRTIRRGLADLAGQRVADIAMNGVLSQMGVDLHSRLGLQNIIPGSAIMKPSTTDKSREFQDLLGPAASVVAAMGQALQDLATGRPDKAALAMAPVAVQNAVKGAKMAATGSASDMRGKPTIQVSAAEAAAKVIGFNPKAVADYGTAKRYIMQDERLLDVTRERFTAAIVDAIIAGDDEARREALQQVVEWNRRSPDARININPAAIRRRVADMRAEGPARIIKSLSPSLRQQARQEFADAR